MWVIPGLLETNRCPRRTLAEDELEPFQWLELYDQFKSGFLPHAGGFLDQPAVFNDAMRLLQIKVNAAVEEHTNDGTKGKGGG